MTRSDLIACEFVSLIFTTGLLIGFSMNNPLLSLVSMCNIVEQQQQQQLEDRSRLSNFVISGRKWRSSVFQKSNDCQSRKSAFEILIITKFRLIRS